MQVALLERQALPATRASHDPFDLRISAINRRSEAWLEALGAMAALNPARIFPYQTLRCFEGASTPLDFTADELGVPHLGYMIENNEIQAALWQQLPDAVQRFCPVDVVSLAQDADCASLVLSDGQTLNAQIVIAADGALSSLRQLAGIGQTGWQYQQACLLINVKTTYPSVPMTWQQFTEQGPRAYLPLPEQNASLVWYDQHTRVAQLAKLTPSQLQHEIQQHFPPELGEFSVLQAAYFPLTRSHANQYYAHRVVLVGDAAHTINPLAGQGVNLGFADAQVLATLLKAQWHAGQDLAEPSLLTRYERERRMANSTMMTAMDAFYHVFGSSLGPIRTLRQLGLQLAGKAGPLKTLVGKYAAGLV
jgi:2-octaprenyl-3-methyl-6-methoxy-1,4-benzoquinol hydroxylase